MNALKHGGRSRAFLDETRSISETLRRASDTLMHIRRLVRISGMTAKRELGGLPLPPALKKPPSGLSATGTKAETRSRLITLQIVDNRCD
jgi:hypothetical protein